MTLETKFNFNDEVWCMFANHCCEGKITHIEVRISPYGKSFQRTERYAIKYPNGDVSHDVRPELIFRSKEELLKSL